MEVGFDRYYNLARSEATRLLGTAQVEFQYGEEEKGWHPVSGPLMVAKLEAKKEKTKHTRSMSLPASPPSTSPRLSRRSSSQVIPAKRLRSSRTDEASPKRARVESIPEADLNKVTQITFDFLVESLSDEYHIDVTLPSPTDVHLILEDIPRNDTISRQITRVVPVGSDFLRAFRGEIEQPQRIPGVRLQVVHTDRRTTCTGTVGCKSDPEGYCPCTRRFFLKAPTETQVWKKVRNCSSSAHLEAMAEHGPDVDVPDGDYATHKSLDGMNGEPYFSAVEKGIQQFVSLINTTYQRLNIIAALVSPSTYIEALLIAVVHRKQQTDGLFKNPVAEEYLHGQNALLKEFPSQIAGVLEKQKITNNELYELLLPYYHKLAKTRGFEPLKKSQELKRVSK